MVKVVSFKTSDEIYNKLKKTGKSFRATIEPLLVAYLNEKHSIPHCVPKETLDDYEPISKKIDRLLGG